MSDSVMKMADEIMGGMLTAAVDNPVTSPMIQKTQEDLPEISNQQRNSFINESVVDEDLGKELKPHARTGEKRTSPGSTEKHTSVSMSSDDEKNLSPGAKAKLGSHRQRSSSRQDRRTSGYVDRPRTDQKAKWASEKSRQQKHTAARGQSTRGAEPKKGTTPQAGVSPDRSNTNVGTMGQRKARLTPAHQTQMAKKAQGHVQRRHAQANKDREARKQQGLTRARQTYQSSQNAGTINMDKKRITIVEKGKKDDNWIQGAEADIKRRGTEGKCTPITKPGCTGKAKALAKTFKKMAKKSKAENAGLTRKQYDTLVEAQQILKEMTSVGSIGTTQGANMHGSANKAYDADAKPMGKDTPKIAPVDKSLRKVSKALKGKQAAKKNKVKKEAFERFLDAILSDAQKAAPRSKTQREIDQAAQGKPDAPPYAKRLSSSPAGAENPIARAKRLKAASGEKPLGEQDVPTGHGDIPGSHGGHTRASVDKPRMTKKPETPEQKKARKDSAARGAAAQAADRAGAEAYNKRDPHQAIYKQIARTKERNLAKKKAAGSLGK